MYFDLFIFCIIVILTLAVIVLLNEKFYAYMAKRYGAVSPVESSHPQLDKMDIHFKNVLNVKSDEKSSEQDRH